MEQLIGIRIARRSFLASGGLALALALSACATVTAADGAAAVQQQHVAVPAAAGTADALLFTPPGGASAPAVILWSDIGGLRPAIVEIGRKLAGEGYVVLAPNAFYRSVKLDGSTVSDADARTRMTEWRGPLTKETVGADSRAYMAYLDALPQVDRKRSAGALGYDIGSAYAFFAAQAMPSRIGAVAAIHPTGTATTRDNSPHLFVGESKAQYYVALASDDDAREPEDKGQYREEFAKAGLTGVVEILDAGHGFALPDSDKHDPATSGQVWDRVRALFANALK